MPKFLFAIPLALGVCCLATAAEADDWVAQKLRGEAFVMVQGSWVQLKRGDIVANSAAVRTMKDGQVEFIRDKETITLGPDTQIRIFDRSGQRYTTVKEAFGSVRVEANVENVKHFSVQTPFLAATVKGTIFTVVSGATAAEVQVQRGKVSVEDSHHELHVDVLPGQSASVGRVEALRIAGLGKLAPIVNAAGEPVASPSVTEKDPKHEKDNKKDNGDGDTNANVNGSGDDKGKSKNGNGNNGDGNNGNGNNGNGNNGNGNNGDGKGKNGNGNNGDGKGKNGNGNGNGNNGNGKG